MNLLLRRVKAQIAHIKRRRIPQLVIRRRTPMDTHVLTSLLVARVLAFLLFHAAFASAFAIGIALAFAVLLVRGRLVGGEVREEGGWVRGVYFAGCVGGGLV